ncbi:MAG: hypothetical protein WC701_12695 [Kiritimatiellales bacterium]|jgi:hypothetical protein
MSARQKSIIGRVVFVRIRESPETAFRGRVDGDDSVGGMDGFMGTPFVGVLPMTNL